MASYQPGTINTENKKAAEALINVVENLKKNINDCNEKSLTEQAGFFEAYITMIEDPAMSGAIADELKKSRAAPKSIANIRLNFCSVSKILFKSLLREGNF